ncbi:hypothetical protein AOLI_G00085000 [Acnodon oligacanthus]
MRASTDKQREGNSESSTDVLFRFSEQRNIITAVNAGSRCARAGDLQRATVCGRVLKPCSAGTVNAPPLRQHGATAALEMTHSTALRSQKKCFSARTWRRLNAGGDMIAADLDIDGEAPRRPALHTRRREHRAFR